MYRRVASVMICLLLFLSVLSLPVVGIEDTHGPKEHPWPMIHGGPRLSGLSRYDTSYETTPQIKWTFQAEDTIDTNPVIDKNGVIYFGCDDRNLYAINPDGTLKWTFETGSTIYGSPAIAKDGTIYVGCWDGLFAVNTYGTLKWKLPFIGAYGSPIISNDGRIYMVGSGANLLAISPQGTKVWSYPLEGALGWKCPAMGGDGSILISYYRAMSCINPDGTERWSIVGQWGMSLENPSIGDDGSIYYHDKDHTLMGFDPSGDVKWVLDSRYDIFSGTCIGSDGTIYAALDDNNDGCLFAVSDSGEELWRKAMDERLDYPIVGSRGTIYLSGAENLYAFYPNGTMKWEMTVGNTSENTSPAISASGTIYLGTTDGRLLAIVGDTEASTIDDGGSDLLLIGILVATAVVITVTWRFLKTRASREDN